MTGLQNGIEMITAAAKTPATEYRTLRVVRSVSTFFHCESKSEPGFKFE
jgi:hypothetical protein